MLVQSQLQKAMRPFNAAGAAVTLLDSFSVLKGQMEMERTSISEYKCVK
jgi:hypothetical protein